MQRAAELVKELAHCLMHTRSRKGILDILCMPVSLVCANHPVGTASHKLPIVRPRLLKALDHIEVRCLCAGVLLAGGGCLCRRPRRRELRQYLQAREAQGMQVKAFLIFMAEVLVV